MPSSSLAEFYGGISAAIVIKLTSSIDDVLWLSAFLIPSLSTRQRVRNAATYACVCLLQTILAFVISTFGEEAVDAVMTHQQHSSIQLSTDRILTLIAGAILFVYSIVLGVEYYRENCGEEEKGDYSAIELVEQDEEMIVDEITISEAGGQTRGESTTNEVEGNIEAHMNIDTEQKGTTIDEPSAPPTSDKKSSSLALGEGPRVCWRRGRIAAENLPSRFLQQRLSHARKWHKRPGLP